MPSVTRGAIIVVGFHGALHHIYIYIGIPETIGIVYNIWYRILIIESSIYNIKK